MYKQLTLMMASYFDDVDDEFLRVRRMKGKYHQ